MAEDAAESGERKRPHLVSILPLFILFFSTSNEAAEPMTALVGSADVNGDGINGDLLTTTRRGDVGRSIDSVAKLNDLIHAYNQLFAGKRNPRNQLLPFVPDVADNIKFGDSFISQDLQLSYVLKLKERVKLEATAQLFNAFNVSNLVGAAGLPSSAFNGALATLATLWMATAGA
jgi:hypothetical protein